MSNPYTKTELTSLLKLAHDQIKSRDEIIGSMHITISNLQATANASHIEVLNLRKELCGVVEIEEDCSTL